ncbi:MAG: hypothetical protein OEV55_05820 [candidate division Zixibacteria bacterium]|nr:hypothetical protein [candidate division Zixibacteria bacterium]
MNSKHLTDEEFQDYLDERHPAESGYMEEHLRTCQLCRNNLREYKSLYAELKAERGFELSPNFAESVMSRLPDVEIPVSQTRYATIIMSAFSILVVISIAIYLLNWKWFIQTISVIPSPFFKAILVFGNSIAGFFAHLNVGINLLLMSFVILLVISLLDYLLFSKKRKLISFFQVAGNP